MQTRFTLSAIIQRRFEGYLKTFRDAWGPRATPSDAVRYLVQTHPMLSSDTPVTYQAIVAEVQKELSEAQKVTSEPPKKEGFLNQRDRKLREAEAAQQPPTTTGRTAPGSIAFEKLFPPNPGMTWVMDEANHVWREVPNVYQKRDVRVPDKSPAPAVKTELGTNAPLIPGATSRQIGPLAWQCRACDQEYQTQDEAEKCCSS